MADRGRVLGGECEMHTEGRAIGCDTLEGIERVQAHERVVGRSQGADAVDQHHNGTNEWRGVTSAFVDELAEIGRAHV